ncbi:hypothetical protein LX64_03692 [Chitinophaga skermanii]|uniref:Uncharacterized protein n=1 Tax=Chitinophaga skermanii TaxID=331697 RepID=A0A327QIF2_9BACT|nr:hypothetical protein [Chitinophaga skermanii]RAJ01477.1 hypothetical protein LX64_03692 [Chitinophaga skermanii]
MMLFAWLAALVAAPAQHDTIPKIVVEFSVEQRAVDKHSDTIFYNASAPLTWQDFTRKPPQNAKNDAVSYTSFAYEGGTRQRKDTVFVHLVLQVFFIKSASWVTPPLLNDLYSLQHEQIHFDITYLTGLLFRNKVLSIDFSEDGDYDSIIQYQYLEYFRLMNVLQESYDAETRHGNNATKQREWQQNINRAITLGGVWPLPNE